MICATLTVIGKQGHVAYPDRALNPIPLMIRMLRRLEVFESRFIVTSIDVGNTTTNIIPSAIVARVSAVPKGDEDYLVELLSLVVQSAQASGVNVTVEFA